MKSQYLVEVQLTHRPWKPSDEKYFQLADEIEITPSPKAIQPSITDNM